MNPEHEHRNHHAATHAAGTSGHNHHRRVMEQAGIRVQFWRCDLAAGGPCPDEPDPLARLLVRIAEAAVPVPADCLAGHGPEHRKPRKGWPSGETHYCGECHRLRAEQKRRMARTAKRISDRALAA